MKWTLKTPITLFRKEALLKRLSGHYHFDVSGKLTTFDYSQVELTICNLFYKHLKSPLSANLKKKNGFSPTQLVQKKINLSVFF